MLRARRLVRAAGRTTRRAHSFARPIVGFAFARLPQPALEPKAAGIEHEAPCAVAAPQAVRVPAPEWRQAEVAVPARDRIPLAQRGPSATRRSAAPRGLAARPSNFALAAARTFANSSSRGWLQLGS